MPSADKEVAGPAYIAEILLAAAERQVVNQRTHEPIPARVVCIAIVGVHVGVIIHVLAVVSLATRGDGRAGRHAESVRIVLGPSVMVRKLKIISEAVIQL